MSLPRKPPSRPDTAHHCACFATADSHRNDEGVVEACWTKLFALWKTVGFDYHCDLHTAGTLSHPFIFVDR